MKSPQPMTPETFAIRAGLILMTVPSLYWLGVLLAVFFEKPLIVESLMLPIDRISSLLTLLIMVGLPVITIMVNLKSMLHLEFSRDREDMLVDMEVQKSKGQWILIVYAALSIAVTLSYFFFEKFVFFSDNYIH